jgi:hypothetical protein
MRINLKQKKMKIRLQKYAGFYLCFIAKAPKTSKATVTYVGIFETKIDNFY